MRSSRAGAVMALIGLSLTRPSDGKAQSAPESFAHVRNAFSLTVHAPYQEAAPLFGPNGERGWSDGWDPHFFYPQPGRDEAGAVFAIQHGSKHAIWVTTAFDLEARHFQYVYFLPDSLVTVIDVNFEPMGSKDASNTRVHVVYSRTALNAEANERVKALGDDDSRSGPKWEKAVNTYLENRKR